MSKPSKAILIDTANKEMREILVSGYQDLLKYLKCETLAVGMRLPNGDTLYIDDEGLLINPELFFMIRGNDRPMAGNGVIIGCDGGGNDVDYKSASVEVAFLTREEIEPFVQAEEEWAEQERANPNSPYAHITTMRDALGPLKDDDGDEAVG